MLQPLSHALTLTRSHTSLVMMLFVMSGGEEALSAPGGKEKGVLEDKMLGEMLVIN